MADSYDILEVGDEAGWDDFVRRAAGGTVFSTSAWLRCARQATGSPFRCFGCYKNGQLIAGVSGLEQRRVLFTRFSTPPLTPHGGLLCAPFPGKGPAKAEAEWSRAAALLAGHLARRYGHVHLIHAPAVADVREFLWAGWSARVRYTYLIDLRDREALWERLERRTRTVIHKAEKAGFQLHPTGDLDLFQRQYELIYARQGGPPPVPALLVRRFAQQVLEAGLGQAWAIVSPAGQTAAVVVFVPGFGTAHAWVAGADPALNSTGATSLLYWRFFARTALPWFDFVGANLPDIARFKRGFGGDLVPYYAVEGFGSAPARCLFTLSRGVRALRRR
jgi:hypothetical protein